jgi:hypothetical protein
MSILDDAIREHLELKRAHGADEAELKKLEDEAFGPPGRPDDADPFAEAPTEFLTAPATGADEAAADAKAGPSSRREPNIADLQEGPEPTTPEAPTEAPEAAGAAEDPAPAAEEEQPAVEQTIPVPHVEPPPPEPEPTPEPEIDAGHSTEERHAIAEQPTEFFDVEAELDSASEPRSPSDEQLVDAELTEPRLAPVDPLGPIVDTGPDAEVLAEPDEEGDYEEDDFFSEQRLSDELNQALEAPITDEHEVFPTAPEPASPPTEEQTPLPPAEEPTAVFNLKEAEEEHAVEAEEPEDDDEPEAADEEDREDDEDDAPAGKSDDVLEKTPDFLEDAPEDDDLWFEQKPPKDFDFDD